MPEALWKNAADHVGDAVKDVIDGAGDVVKDAAEGRGRRDSDSEIA